MLQYGIEKREVAIVGRLTKFSCASFVSSHTLWYTGEWFLIHRGGSHVTPYACRGNFGPLLLKYAILVQLEQLWWTKIAHSRSLWSRGFRSLRIRTKSYIRVLCDTLHCTSRVYFSWHVPLLVELAVVLIANQVGFYYSCLFFQPGIHGPTSPNWSEDHTKPLGPRKVVLIRWFLLIASNLIETVKSTKNEWIQYHPFWMRFAWLFISKVAGSVI